MELTGKIFIAKELPVEEEGWYARTSCRLVTWIVPRWTRLFLRERSSVSWERGRLKVGWLCDGALRMACTSNKQTQRIQCKHATRGRNEACCADRRI